MAEIRRIADGEGRTAAAPWDEQNRTGIDAGTGLLPGLVGEIDALYVTPQALGGGTSSAPAKAAIAELRARGADVIHNLVCIEDDEAPAFWQAQGFERDMVACRCTGGAEQR
jgi:GNAT superfamily N-acetyltransferase